MDPKSRMIECIKAGKAVDEIDYCEKILRSTNPAAREHKGFCLMHKVKSLTKEYSNFDWWKKLRDREMAGKHLTYFQSWAWKEAQGREKKNGQQSDGDS